MKNDYNEYKESPNVLIKSINKRMRTEATNLYMFLTFVMGFIIQMYILARILRFIFKYLH